MKLGLLFMDKNDNALSSIDVAISLIDIAISSIDRGCPSVNRNSWGGDPESLGANRSAYYP